MLHLVGCTLRTSFIYYIELYVKTSLRSVAGPQMSYKIYLEEKISLHYVLKTSLEPIAAL